jgi:hypothetical protein
MKTLTRRCVYLSHQKYARNHKMHRLKYAGMKNDDTEEEYLGFLFTPIRTYLHEKTMATRKLLPGTPSGSYKMAVPANILYPGLRNYYCHL